MNSTNYTLAFSIGPIIGPVPAASATLIYVVPATGSVTATNIVWSYTNQNVTQAVQFISPSIIATSNAASSTTTPQPASTTTTSNAASSSSTNTTADPSNSTSSVAPSPRTYSEGTTAGIAIACSIGCALIAFLIGWFCLGKRARQTKTARLGNGSLRVAGSSFATAKADEISLNKSGPGWAGLLDSRLPAVLEESALESKFSTLDSYIRSHVLSYYEHGPVQRSAAPAVPMASQLERVVGRGAPATGKEIEAFLANPQSRSSIIRFLLAWSILSRIQPDATTDQSLLPSELVDCLQAAHTSFRDPTDRDILLAKWRQITGVILRSKYGQPEMARDDARRLNIGKLADLLHIALATYASPGSDDSRRKNLEEIVKQSARFGFTLCTQPSAWAFDWTGRQAKKFVVWPALLQISDNDGHLRAQPEIYGDKQVVDLTT